MKKRKIVSLLTAAVLCSGVSSAVLADEETAVPVEETVAEQSADTADEAVDTAEDITAEAPSDVTEDTADDTIEAAAEDIADIAADAVPVDAAIDTDEAVYGYAEAGRCGDDLVWGLTNGVLSISGTGAMTNNDGWKDRKSSIKEVIIAEGCTSICDYAFDGCTLMKKVTIASSVTNIGNYAFRNCQSIESLTLPNADIGDYAFADCKGASFLKINGGSGDKNIRMHAFQGCDSLVSVSIPNNYVKMEEYAFNNCVSLKSVTIPSGCSHVGQGAFSDCTALERVVFSNGVKSCGTYSFSGCTSLIGIRFPDDFQYIGDHAFQGCTGLKSLTLPNCEIDPMAFGYCDSLTKVVIKGGTSDRKIPFRCFEYCKSLKTISIPNNITAIEEYAFLGCASLQGVTIPSSCTFVGYGGFSDCKSLKRVKVEDGVNSFSSYAFNGCTSLEAINFPTSLRTFGQGVFCNCPALYHVHIPAGKSYKDYVGKGYLPDDPDIYFHEEADGTCASGYCPYDKNAKQVPAVAFDVKGVFGGREVTFKANGSTDKNLKIYYTTENRSTLTRSDKCVANGETVLFENYYGTVYARVYADGRWGNVSRLILKIPVVKDPQFVQNKSTLRISSPTPDTYIVYTTDGSVPSLTNGKRVKGPATIYVTKGMTVKAIAIRSCFTNSGEKTYYVTSVS